jgi:hypothetical protein
MYLVKIEQVYSQGVGWFKSPPTLIHIDNFDIIGKNYLKQFLFCFHYNIYKI